MPSLRAALYARVSTLEQAQPDKASIPAQLQAGRKIAAQRGWSLVGKPYVDAGISGQKFADRPALQQMLQDAEGGLFDLLILYDNDRLSRKGSVAARVFDRLDRAGVQIYSIHQPVEPRAPERYDPEEDDTGLITRSIGSLSSELYLRSFRRRSRMSLEQRAREGYMVKTVPYGYHIQFHRQPDGSLEKRRVLHPQEAPLVKRLFEEYRQGKSFLALAQALNREGVPRKRGNVWYSRTVRTILVNPVYYGEVVYGVYHRRQGKLVRQPEAQWIRAKGQHPALISRELFDEVQAIRHHRARHARAASSPHLLSGLVKCGYCGGAMIRSGAWGGGYFICCRYQQSGTCQRNGKYLVPKLEAMVLAELRRLRQNPQLLAELRQQRREHRQRDLRQEENLARQRLAELPARQKRLWAAYERGLLSLGALEERKTALAAEGHRLQQVWGQLQQQLVQQQQRQRTRASVQELLRTFDQKFAQLPRPQQKQLLQNLIEKVVVQ